MSVAKSKFLVWAPFKTYQVVFFPNYKFPQVLLKAYSWHLNTHNAPLLNICIHRLDDHSRVSYHSRNLAFAWMFYIATSMKCGCDIFWMMKYFFFRWKLVYIVCLPFLSMCQKWMWKKGYYQQTHDPFNIGIEQSWTRHGILVNWSWTHKTFC